MRQSVVPANAREVLLVCTIDTEEDNWTPSRTGLSARNIGRLLEHHRWLTALGVVPTYLVTHQVLVNTDAAGVLQQIATEGRVQFGAHLHPWNTPPFPEPLDELHSMLCNLPPAVQRAKLERLGDSFAAALGERPVLFRAGKCALGSATVGELVRQGYLCDSSVLPFHDLTGIHGPDFRGAPVDAYRLGADGDPRDRAGDGELVEVPLSAGFSRRPFRSWGALHAKIGGRVGRALRLPGITSRTGIVRRVALAPEYESVGDMVNLSLRLVEEGARYLVVTWHSPTLLPGCTPYARTWQDVDQLRSRIGQLVNSLAGRLPFRVASLGEAAAALASHPRSGEFSLRSVSKPYVQAIA